MAMTSIQPGRPAGAVVLPAAAGRAGFGGALRSELTKIRSVRSTYWTLLALVVACVGIGALFSWGEAQHVASLAGTRDGAAVAARAHEQAVATSLFGLLIGQLVIVVLGAVIGGGLFLTVCGLLSFGIGALLRHTAGAITASIGLTFVLYMLSGFLPDNWAVHIDKWIPFNAGAAIWEQLSGRDMFHPWTGFAGFCGYAAIAIAGGLILFRRRDA